MSRIKKIYNVGIIGAGRIGAGFDGPSFKNVLTHAHAFLNNKRTKLVGFVDINSIKGKKEAKRWGTEYFRDIKTMFLKTMPDIVVIATPDVSHARILTNVARYNPKLIICEKPLVAKFSDLAKIENKFCSDSIPVLVNYSRRFDKKIDEAQKRLLRGAYGKVIAASGIYTGGLLHNGSHMVDFARLLFGEMSVRGNNIKFERCPKFTLIEGDQSKYSIFELDILAEKSRLRFTDSCSKLEIQGIIPSKLYIKFFVLGKSKIVKTQLYNSFSELARHAVAILDKKECIKYPLDEAIKTQKAVFKLAKIIKK